MTNLYRRSTARRCASSFRSATAPAASRRSRRSNSPQRRSPRRSRGRHDRDRLQTPVNIRRILLDGRLPLHHMVVRREMSDLIGGAGVAGEGEGLAATAAEINLAALAAPTRLRQEGRAPEGVEGQVPLDRK